jgi:hypothetical protein
MLIVEHGIDLRAGEKLAADLAIFQAQDDSDLSALQGDCGLLVLAVRHADGSQRRCSASSPQSR